MVTAIVRDSEQSIRRCPIYQIVDQVYHLLYCSIDYRKCSEQANKWEANMAHRDSIFATVALLLSTVALAGVLSTDEYTLAAGVEADGYAALERQVAGDVPMLCLNDVNDLNNRPGAAAGERKSGVQ
jgi:hypothetical protein